MFLDDTGKDENEDRERRISSQMHGWAGGHHSTIPVGPVIQPKEIFVTNTDIKKDTDLIDVRSLMPAQRHAKIFQLINNLTPGAAFILVNDHDPKPLYYQLEAEFPNQFAWTYLERGPEVWRVQVGKRVEAA